MRACSLLVATAVATLLAPPSDATLSAPRVESPMLEAVIDRDFPDPSLLAIDGRYFAYATNANGANVQAATSSDLRDWNALPDALPELPAWARRGKTWAPEVRQIDGRFVMYFAADDRASDRQCLGVAVATQPDQPFHPLANKLVCQPHLGGAIDPMQFTDLDGTRYLLWKNDGNRIGAASTIWLARLSADGTRIDGSETALLRADLGWEGGIVEAPTLVRRNGRYHLFYSANAYAGSAYAIGHAVATNLLGPYRKDRSPLVASAFGPGGQDIVEHDGRTYLGYHSWDAGRRYRRLNLAPLSFEASR